MNARAAIAALVVFGLGALALVWSRPEHREAPATARAEMRAETAYEQVELPPRAETDTRTTAFQAESAAPPSDLAPPVRPAPLAADDPVQCVLYGRVLCSDGHAFAWAPSVVLTDGAGTSQHATVGERGQYSLTGLAPGAWNLSVECPGYHPQRDTLQFTLAQPLLRRDFVLERATVLAVRVLTPGGELLSDALAERGQRPQLGGSRPFAMATREPPGATLDAPITPDADAIGVGRFWEFGPLADAAGPEFAGVLELFEEPPVFVSLTLGTRVLETRRVEPGTKEVTFVVDPDTWVAQQSSVQARFVAEDTHMPVRGQLDVEPLHTSFTVQDGTWKGTLSPGRYTFTFWARGYARIPREIELAPGEALDLGEIVVPRELTIEGRLLDDHGEPVVGRLELGRRDERGGLRFEQDFAYQTDGHGAFKVIGLVPGRYTLRATVEGVRGGQAPAWVSGLVEVSALGGSVTGLDIRLVKAGSIVLNGIESLPAGCAYRVLDARGDELAGERLERALPLVHVPPGQCTLLLLGPGGAELSRQALEVGEKPIAVELAP